VSDIKKHLKRKFIEKPSQDDKGMEKDENNHDNTPLDTEHHHHPHFVGKKISVQRSKGIGKK
jgi:hypothetical protein